MNMHKEMREAFNALWADSPDDVTTAAREGAHWALGHIIKTKESAHGVGVEAMTPEQLSAILLEEPDPEFWRIVALFPKTHWGRLDLSALHLGYELAKRKTD